MRFFIIILFAIFFSGCNTRIAWEDGKFTIDPFGGRYATQQPQQQPQQQQQQQQQQQNVYIINNHQSHRPNTGYSATSPNHSMVQFNANRHSFGNLP